MAKGGLSEYSRHRGQTLKAVQKAIAAGRISGPKNGEIDFDVADAEWTRNTAPRAGAKENPNADTSIAYASARARRESYNAKLARLDYQVKRGKLVERVKVDAVAFATFRRLRDQLLTIPDRKSAELAAETDAAVVHRILDQELRDRLTEFANGIRAGASPVGGSVVHDGSGGGSVT